MNRARQAGLIVGLWTLWGVIMAVQSHYSAALSNRPITGTRAFALELAYSYLWAAVTPPVLWLARRSPLTRVSLWRHVPLHLAAAVLLSLATKAAWDLICLEPAKRWKAIAVAVDYGVLEYSLILLSLHVWQYHRRSAQLEAQLVHAQLAALRMQLQPHFLFNTLHAISESIHQNPGAAERMIVRLSEFFRLTLDTSGAAEVTLRPEIDFLERYLEIEKVRFEERLQVNFDVDPVTLDAAVPNFLLQPLVENALRHGLAHRLEGGLLRIECRRADGRLHLKVADNGPGPRCKQIRPGYGLGSLSPLTTSMLSRPSTSMPWTTWSSPSTAPRSAPAARSSSAAAAVPPSAPCPPSSARISP